MKLIIGGEHDGERINIPENLDRFYLPSREFPYLSKELSVYFRHSIVDQDRKIHIVYAAEGVNVIDKLIRNYKSENCSLQKEAIRHLHRKT